MYFIYYIYLKMIIFLYENILSLIFNTLNLKDIKELFAHNSNATLAHILLKKITFEKLFKSIGKLRTVLNEHKKWIDCIALLPESNNIVLVSEDKQLNIYDIEKLKISKSFKYPYQIDSILALPDGNIACCTELGQVDIIDINNNFEPINTISLDDYIINGIYLLPNGDLFCTADDSSNWFMAIFDDDYNCTRTIDIEGDTANSIVFPPDRFAFGSNSSVEVWNLKDNYN
jgi:WD40 repeat protein